jgi:hypothetical protein
MSMNYYIILFFIFIIFVVTALPRGSTRHDRETSILAIRRFRDRDVERAAQLRRESSRANLNFTKKIKNFSHI